MSWHIRVLYVKCIEHGTYHICEIEDVTRVFMWFIKHIEENRSNESLYIAIDRSFGNEFNKFTCSTFVIYVLWLGTSFHNITCGITWNAKRYNTTRHDVNCVIP